MAIERVPAAPLPQNYRPPGGVAYQVQADDDWIKVARRIGVDVWDLIAFNFKTRDPAEVNWYLRRNVGCQNTTHDGRNYVFRGARPGIIYLPGRAGAPPPAPQPSGLWFGVGAKGGGHFFVIGKETVEAWLCSYDRYEDNFFMNIDSWRFGPGLGGSAQGCLVIVANCTNPTQLQGAVTSEWDFQANLGGRWGDLAKGVRGLNWVRRSVKAQKVVKGAITFGEWEKTRDLVKDSVKALTADTKSGQPQVITIGIPYAGLGLELSGYFVFGEIMVHGVSVRQAR